MSFIRSSSAFGSTKQTIVWNIEDYHFAFGVYPDSLGDLTFEWSEMDGGTEQTLKAFYYENRGDSYVFWGPEEHYIIPMKNSDRDSD